MTPAERALALAIRWCPWCMVSAPGQPVDLLCSTHRRRLDALLPDRCDDPACTACPPAPAATQPQP